MSTALIETARKLPEGRKVPAGDIWLMMSAIEAGRIAARLSREEMGRLSGLSASSYRRYSKHQRRPAPAALRRMARALSSREAQGPREAGLLQALAVRMLEELARAVDGKQARNLAIYLAHMQLAMPQMHLARLYGVSRNRINMVIQKIEARRDDGNPLDRALLALDARLEADAMCFLREPVGCVA